MTARVNAECRDASKNTLRTVRGLLHKKLLFCMWFLVKSVSIGKLSFSIWSGFIQSPYSLADLFKIHPIVWFDYWNIRLHLADPISGGRAVKPAVQKAQNKWSGLCAIEIADKRLAFSIQTLHRALIQNRPKIGKMSISPIAQGFF